MATHEMSRIEMELNTMNTTSDESSVMTMNEAEQKSITALDELLQQELKEVDPVDCFIKKVGHASEDSSECGLNYDDASVVSGSTFYSPKEDTSTDNNSLQEKELEDTLNKDKEETFTSDTDKLPSGEEAAAVKDNTPVTNTSVEGTDEGTTETKDKGEDDTSHKNDAESGQIQEKENSMITEETDSEAEDQIDNKDTTVEEETKEKETDDDTKEKESDDEIKENETSDETKEKEPDDELKENETSDETKEKESGDEMKENEISDETKEKESVDEMKENEISDETKEKESGDEMKEMEMSDEAMETETSDETEEKETSDEVQDSTEVELPSEIPNSRTEQTEKDTNNESTKTESPKEARKDALYIVFHPKEEGNKKNNSGKDNESPRTIHCSETSTTTSSVVKSITVPDRPVTKAVFSISTGSKAMNGKEINKAIIVKKVTAKIIKTGNTVTIKTAKKSDDGTNEGTPSNTKSSEPEEKPQNKSDTTKQGESEKQTQNDAAAALKVGNPETILTRKVYGKRKKSPQEGQVPDTKEKDITNMATQDHLNNADHDKDSVSGNEVKPKTRAGNKGKTLPHKSKVNGKEKDESIEKRLANCGTLKRKFEEICRISWEEEDAAIKEIKKMKRETLVVLKKINAEMEKLKSVFLARK